MAVDTPRIEYNAALSDWQRMRDVLAGQSAMRSNAELYLRRATGLTDAAAWAAYVNATPFYEATLRTLEGMTGLAFYHDPELTFPDELKPFIDDATGDGVPFMQFVEGVTEEVLSIARVGVMVDFPPADQSIVTKRDEELSGRRAFVRRYFAEDILSWRSQTIAGKLQLVEVRLRETVEEPDPNDEFGIILRQNIRVLELLVSDGAKPEYRQRIFKAKEADANTSSTGTGNTASPRPMSTTIPSSTEDWIEQSPIVPVIAGVPLDFIPFWIVNPTDQTPDIKRPPMLGLANINVAHFNTSGQLENALYYVGNPQAWVTGQDPNDMADGLVIGASKAWVFADKDAQVGILSLESDKVQALENRLDRFEEQMAILGARMLSADKPDAEAAETARIHRQGEVSVLAGTCGSVSRAMTDVVRVVALWQSAIGATIVKLTTNFFDETLDPLGALNLVKVWQAGGMGFTDLIANLQRGGLLAAERTADDISSENQSGNNPIYANLTAPPPPPVPPVPPVNG